MGIAEEVAALASVGDKVQDRYAAIVTRTGANGTIWVSVLGGADETPCMGAFSEVSPGDSVEVEIRDGRAYIVGNTTSPAASGRSVEAVAGEVVTVTEAVTEAVEAAEEAKRVAEATDQHFFADGNGVHVTEAEGDATTEHNILINSLGILLRKAVNNLVSITQSAISFFDGQGNDASNIVAKFGADGAQIGKVGESHVELDYHSMQLIDKDGSVYFRVSDLLDRDEKFHDWFVGDGTTRDFILSYSPPYGSQVVVKVNDTAVTGVSLVAYYIEFDTAPADGASIEVTYSLKQSDLSKRWTKGLTFGARNALKSVGSYSVACGIGNVASGPFSFALGYNATASGNYSVAQNNGTLAVFKSQTALGEFNIEDVGGGIIGANMRGNYAVIVGNGTADNARSNALAVTWDGSAILQGWAGIIQMFAGTTPPTGWLLCDGSAVSRTTYATLFAAIGTTWGNGDGSTTFNLPDLRGRAPIGAGTGSGLTARTLGGTLGSENIQAHTHSFTQPTITAKYKNDTTASGSARRYVQDGTQTSTTLATASGGAVGAVSGASTGSAGNMQPSAVVNFIIHTGKTS